LSVQTPESSTGTAGLREPGPADLDALLALSNGQDRELGILGKEAFAQLIAMSFRTRMTDARDGFLIALAERAPEFAPNYRWFADRFDRFVYIDRVVVADRARRKGLGRLLYADLVEAAADAGYARVCCEVNIDPPNPVSDAFHAALGFAEIGRTWLPDRRKTVRYLMRAVQRCHANRARPSL
jgi:uncharacterized protein